MYESMLQELIQLRGYDVYYMPRENLDQIDTLYGENLMSSFEKAFFIEMYIESSEQWAAGGDFMNRWQGFGSNDNIHLVVSKRTFNQIVTDRTRPQDGDLIYIPVIQKIFEIKFVDEELLFYTKGNRIPYVYELRCEVFRASNEKIETGVPEIDLIDALTSYNIELILTGVGSYQHGEIVYQGSNVAYATASARVNTWDRANNTITLHNVAGKFEPGSNVIGMKSETSRYLASLDTLGDQIYYDSSDNKLISGEANTLISQVEINPLGKP